jgi:hypothetical protein
MPPARPIPTAAVFCGPAFLVAVAEAVVDEQTTASGTVTPAVWQMPFAYATHAA